MAINQDVHERLINYKFGQTEVAIRRQFNGDGPKPTEDEIALVEALSAMLNNPGWFDGHLSTVIDAAIDSITPNALREPS